MLFEQLVVATKPERFSLNLQVQTTPLRLFALRVEGRNTPRTARIPRLQRLELFVDHFELEQRQVEFLFGSSEGSRHLLEHFELELLDGVGGAPSAGVPLLEALEVRALKTFLREPLDQLSGPLLHADFIVRFGHHRNCRSTLVSMELREPTLRDDPLELFQSWYEAVVGVMPHRDAMSLATVSTTGRPRVRMVLFRGLVEVKGQRALSFYTSVSSAKGQELAANPSAAACLWWPEAEAQVRVEGVTEQLPSDTADAYWQTRPRLSQLSAAVSEQSSSLSSFEALASRRDELERSLAGAPVPRPPDWGGYGLIPNSIELWREGEGRLHRRWKYSRGNIGDWTGELLNP